MNFAIILFSGLIVHTLFTECVNRAPGLVLSNVNYVKRVVFPLEVLPVIALGTALFHFIVSLLILLTAMMVFGLNFYLTSLFLPLIIIPLILLTLGVSWFMAAMGLSSGFRSCGCCSYPCYAFSVAGFFPVIGCAGAIKKYYLFKPPHLYH